MSDAFFHTSAYFSYDFVRKKTDPLEFKFTGVKTFLYLTEGNLTVSLPQNELVVQAGEILFLPPNWRRSFAVTNCDAMVGKVFCFRYWPAVGNLDYSPQIIQPTGRVTEYFFAIPRIKEKDQINCSHIWKIYRFVSEVQTLMKRNNLKHVEKIQKVLEYMNEHDYYTIPELVEVSGMSKSRFYEAFFKTTGMTPIEAKQQTQAYKAEFLLKNTNLTIEEICRRVGFFSTTHFRKIFCSRYGVKSLKEFRKLQK